MERELKILLLEDNSSDAELISYELRAASLSLTINCVDRREAFLKQLAEFHPDVILSDYHLPDFDGIQALGLVREISPLTPFIFVSGVMGEDVAIESLKQGATDYVLKQNLSRLVPAVHRAIREAEERRGRRQAQEALRRSEQRYRLLVKSLPAVVFQGYWDWSVDFFDDKIEELTGYTKEEFDSRALRWCDVVIPEDLPHVSQIFRESLPRNRYFVREYRISHKGGNLRWIQDRGQVTVDAAGRVEYISGVIFDITRRKRTEAGLRRREAILEAVSLAAQRFLAGSSWEQDIQEILGRLGHALDVSRAHIYQNHSREDGALLASLRHEWVAPGIPPLLGQREYQNIPWEESGLETYRRRLEQGMLVYGHMRDFPLSEWKVAIPLDLKSMVAVPIFVGQQWWGGLGFDACAAEREWSPMELEALKAAASTLGAAIQHEQAEQALSDSARKLRLLTSQILTAQEKERKRISRELHDELGQALTVMKLNLRSLEKKLPAQDAMREDFQQMLRYLDQVIDDVRRLSRDLSPSILEDLGLLSALKHLVHEFSKHYRIDCDFDLESLDGLFDQEAQIIIYRIFQESLTNIAKHAQASRVKLAIKPDNGAVSFTVVDNGKGFEVNEVQVPRAAGRGLGLASLHERARMLGGSLQVWSQKGQGTKMIYHIPLPSREERNTNPGENPRGKEG